MSANIYSKKWLDQVFEKHNKNYGAYYLRLHADDYTIAGLIFSLATVSVIILFPVLVKYFSGNNSANAINPFDQPFTLTEVVLPEKPFEIKVAKPAAATFPISKSDIVKPVIVNDANANNKRVTDPDENPNHLNGNPGNTFVSDTAIADLTGGTGSTTLPSVDTTIFRGGVEVMPEFPGGEKAMLQFLTGHLKYPAEHISDRISGVVYLSFVINKEGSVTSIETLKGIKESRDFENEARRVVAMMPNWIPGRQNGHNVNVYFTLPVRFSVR